ncbi:uncharacterized protein LOC143231528 isoform X2 [Tachypleus tridentatus]
MPQLTALDVVCGKQHMSVHLEFSAPFYGLVFSKGHYEHKNCVYVKPHSGLSYVEFNIYYNACGTTPNMNGNFFENTIIIQYGMDIIEAWDEAKKLRCQWYDAYQKDSKKELIKISELDIVELNFQGDNVDCWMEIQEGKGPWSNEVSGIIPVGSPLTMVIAINDYGSQFDMRVKSCYAHDSIKPLVALTDEYGCVLRPKILTSFHKVRDYNGRATIISYSHFYAFKFPDTVAVYIECSVEICRHGCPDSCQKIHHLPLFPHKHTDNQHAASLHNDKYFTAQQKLDDTFVRYFLNSSYPVLRDFQMLFNYSNPETYPINPVPSKSYFEGQLLLQKLNNESNLLRKPSYAYLHLGQKLNYEEQQIFKRHDNENYPVHKIPYKPQDSNLKQYLPYQNPKRENEEYSEHLRDTSVKNSDYIYISKTVPHRFPSLTQYDRPRYYGREKETPTQHDSRTKPLHSHPFNGNIRESSQIKPRAQSFIYNRENIPLSHPSYPYPLLQFQYSRQHAYNGMKPMNDQIADQSDAIHSTEHSGQGPHEHQFPQEPSSLRTRRQATDGEVIGVEQTYHALALVDLVFEPNTTKDNVFSGRSEEVVYGVCLPVAGFVAGLCVFLLLTICSLCITGYLGYLWRLHVIESNTKTSNKAKIFKGILFYDRRDCKSKP